MSILKELKESIIKMDPDKSKTLTKEGLEQGLDPEELLTEALIPAMEVVGEEFQQGKRFVPEMIISAESMKEAMSLLKPLLVMAKVKSSGKVVMGTVEGDLHDIGLNLVSMMLEGTGFEVFNLGTENPADKFIQAIKKYKPNLLGMSALLTTTMSHMAEVMDALKKNGIRDKVKVMAGGAPITQEFADKIGADGYAPDAASAQKLAKHLMKY